MIIISTECLGKGKKRYPIKSQCNLACVCERNNAISNKRCKLRRYGFRNSIEQQTVSPCLAHVQGSCFT